jgi:hypothetical protein
MISANNPPYPNSSPTRTNGNKRSLKDKLRRQESHLVRALVKGSLLLLWRRWLWMVMPIRMKMLAAGRNNLVGFLASAVFGRGLVWSGRRGAMVEEEDLTGTRYRSGRARQTSLICISDAKKYYPSSFIHSACRFARVRGVYRLS